MRRNRDLKWVLLLAISLGWGSFARAQVSFLASQYYDNLYLTNPAMAGVQQGVNLNLSYRNQWRTMPGSPVTQAFSAEYGKDRVGAGLSIYNDKAGLYKRMRAVGTYAYHLPINENGDQLHFGISAGVSSENMDRSLAEGDPGDVVLDDYRRKPFLAADLGMALTRNNWLFQAALPNMKKYFEKQAYNIIDRASFLLAASYRLPLDQGGSYLTPRVAFRGADGIGNIVDIGSSISFQDGLLSGMGVYHSNKSFTLGFGLLVSERYKISGFYTEQFSELKTSMGGNFEIGIRANVF